MRSDVNYSHSKNIGEAVGAFCELPIRSYDNFALELDVALDIQSTVLRNRAMGCSDTPNTAEIMPGELLCADNIIRRVTTAEAVGYDEFKEKNPVKMLVGGEHSKWYDNEWSTWRNKNEWTLLGTGDLIRTMSGQSTPEEMCAWLNAQPKSSFKSEVVTEGDDKSIRTTDAKGTLVYSFRYIGGLASDVLQCFDDGRGLQHPPIELNEYADEWVSNYIPTSHVERSTIGGTALFAPEENL